MGSSTSVSRKPNYSKEKLVENGKEEKSEKKNGPTTIEEHIEVVKNAVEFLKGCTDFKTKECYKYLLAIKSSSNLPGLDKETDGGAMEDLIIEVEYAELFPSLWEDFHSVDLSQGHGKSKAKDGEVSIPHQAMSNLKCFKAAWWNFTDWSVKLVDELAKTDALKLYVSDLEDPDLTLEKMQESDSRKHLVKGTLGTIHNMVRHSDKLRKEIRMVVNSADLLRTYASCKILIVQVKCVLILSYILYEDEYNSLEANDSSVGFLVGMLRESVNLKNHKSKRYGFSSAELMQGLNQIAVNDYNKVKIMDNGAVPPMVKMLGETFSVYEKTLAAEGLWKLAFVDDHKKRMRENVELMKGLMHLKKSEDAQLREQCHGALWEIMEGEINLHKDITFTCMDDLKKPEHKRPQAPVQESHVMISYQWDVQPRVLGLRDMLKDKGYNIWIDVEKMGDDILGSMADAVEHAAVVLVCFSEKYKESQSCRTEATYAYKQNKPVIPLMVEEGYTPDGWLGALIGTLKYYKFYDDDVAHSEFAEIVQKLGQQGKPGFVLPVKETKTTSSPSKKVSVSTLPPATSAIPSNSIASWASSDVKKWLEENELQELSPKLKDLDGELLFQMYRQSQRAPEYFHNSMSKELGLNYLQVLKFTRALEKVV